MLLAFRSKAGADVLMLSQHAEPVLRALGREPASQGIFLPEQIDTALAALDAALAPPAADSDREVDAEAIVPVELRQRSWPLRDLLQRARSKGQPVTWQPL